MCISIIPERRKLLLVEQDGAFMTTTMKFSERDLFEEFDLALAKHR